jgi:hypothetical protein
MLRKIDLDCNPRFDTQRLFDLLKKFHWRHPEDAPTFDLIVRCEGDDAGLLLKNNSVAIDRVFIDSPWANHARRRALRKLPGSFLPTNPVHFPLAGRHRVTGIPLSYLP